MAMKVQCMDYFKQVVREAKALGGESLQSFKKTMHWMGHYRGGRCVCKLYKDFAPLSFCFDLFMVSATDDSYPAGCRLFNGGIIAHGAHSTGVGMPELSVTLDPKPYVNWQVHT